MYLSPPLIAAESLLDFYLHFEGEVVRNSEEVQQRRVQGDGHCERFVESCCQQLRADQAGPNLTQRQLYNRAFSRLGRSCFAAFCSGCGGSSGFCCSRFSLVNISLLRSIPYKLI